MKMKMPDARKVGGLTGIWKAGTEKKNRHHKHQNCNKKQPTSGIAKYSKKSDKVSSGILIFEWKRNLCTFQDYGSRGISEKNIEIKPFHT